MTEQTNISVSAIKERVMSRVYTIHVFQKVFNAAVFSVVVFVLALWGIGREVWVARVFQNAPSLTNFAALSHFYLAAFLDTRLVVQVLALLALGALVWLGYNLVRAARLPRSPMQFA
jgi:hypothetical protein